MSRRPRLLIVGPLPPPFGGVGVQVEAILRSPLAEAWSIEIFNTSKAQQQGKPSTVTGWDVVWTLWHLVALPFRLVARRPDVAIVEATADTGFFRDVALALICRGFFVPVVFHWHGAPDSPQFPAKGWRQRFFRFGAGLASRFVILAEPHLAYFGRYVPPERLAAVPNFIDGSPFAHRSPSHAGAVRFLFVGRIGPQKGTDVLLEALSRLRSRAKAVTAVLVGDGESDSALAEARRHPLVEQGAVTLPGRLEAARVDEYLRADVFILPTRTDSFPLAILEAMAAGLPVIASDVGAIPWMLEEGRSGVLVPPGDVGALEHAMEHLTTDPALRRAHGERARERQAAHFDARTVWRKWEEVLLAACGAVRFAPATPGGKVENSWTRT